MHPHTRRLATLALAVAATTVVALAPTLASAATFSSDRAGFIAANSSLVVEGFEAATIGSGGATAFAGPLSSATNNGVFATGSVAPGFALVPDSGDVYVGRDYGGAPTATVSSNVFASDFRLTFGPSVTAVGFDVLDFFQGGGTWLVEAFDAADTSLGLSGAFATNSFIGVTSNVAIASLAVYKPNSGGSIDNLRFGAAGSVPEPSALLLLGLAGCGLVAARRRRVAG